MHRRIVTWLAFLGLSLACSSTASTQRDAGPKVAAAVAATAPKSVSSTDFHREFVQVAKIIRPSVVSIASVSMVDAQSPFEGSPFEFFFRGEPQHQGKQRRQGMGSGVIVDARGYILTNNHVVANADELKVVLQDDRELPAKLVGADPKTDIAVVKVELEKGTTLPPATLGDSSRLEVGEWVMAVGSPFGLTQTVSAGIVSAVGRGKMGIADYEDFIQTDAAINPGNSGGPLVDLDGRVIAINTAIASRTGGNQGVGFAIPINMAKAVMDQLIDHGSVVRGYLGVYIGDVTPELAKSFGYDGRGGVLVQDASAGGPGAKAGLKPGDIIVERDGKPIGDVVTFRNAIAQTKPGSNVALTVMRNGKKVAITVKLEALPEDASVAAAQKSSGQRESGAVQRGWGFALSNVTPELRERLHFDAQHGAAVVQVLPDSQAEEAGLRPGDVISQVGNQEVQDVKSAERALLQDTHGKPVRLRVIREGHGMFLLLPPIKK